MKRSRAAGGARARGGEAPLDRLAALSGVLADYRDAWGVRRRLLPATKRGLLAALGLPAETPEEIEASMRRLEEAPFRRMLEPVFVFRRSRGRRLPVPVVLPSADLRASVGWRLEEEGGRVHEGTFRPADLAVGESRIVDGEARERRAFDLPVVPPLGYHRLRLFTGEREAEASLIVAPSRSFLPSGIERGRVWGVAVQLYALRSPQNWGMGDFTDLALFVETAAGLGAGAVGLNPLHALFPGNPAHASPYSPSSRRFLNPLYLDVEAIPDYAECAEARRRVEAALFQTGLARLRESPLVDYVGVAGAKRPVLELLYRSFRERHLGAEPGAAASERGALFRRFQSNGGAALRSFAAFEALAERFGGKLSWREWPAPYRDSGSAEVAAFAEERRDRVEFFEYLEWQANLQLAGVVEKGKALGMPVGLCHDLALAADKGGAEAWANQGLFARGATLGSPPDPWNHRGQDWGLPPYDPHALKAAGYRPFIEVVRANMGHGGALRIDHVMGLMRLYWIPEGVAPGDGGYVRYPFDDLLAILALESRRRRCLVIGEDLGTVPRGFRSRMRRAGVLSYRLLYFQRDREGGFLPPARYPALAAVVVGTHDLATLPGFWCGRDLAVRSELGLYPSREADEEARGRREAERRSLVRALAREGVLAEEGDGGAEELSPAVACAVYRYLGQTPSRLLMVHLEDALGEVNQINLPGTTDEHPNWRRKLPLGVDEIEDDPRIKALALILREARPLLRRARDA